MLNFYREHSRVINKLIINHFGAAFFGLALSLSTARISQTLYLITSIFSVCFLLFLDYTVVWEDGAKSRIRVDAGREAYRPIVGLWLGVWAELPAVVLCVLDSIVYFLSSADGPVRLELKHFLWTIPTWAARLWQAMFLGIIENVAPKSHYLLLLTPLVIILGIFGGYVLGLHQRRIFGAFTLRAPKDKNGGSPDSK